MRRNDLIAIAYGLLTIFIIILLASFLFSLIVHFSSLSEFTLAMMTTVASFIAMFLGGFITGVKGKRRGWLIGFLTGLLFSLFIFLIQFLGFDQSFSFEQSMYHLGYIIAAMLGSMFGVNVAK